MLGVETLTLADSSIETPLERLSPNSVESTLSLFKLSEEPCFELLLSFRPLRLNIPNTDFEFDEDPSFSSFSTVKSFEDVSKSFESLFFFFSFLSFFSFLLSENNEGKKGINN